MILAQTVSPALQQNKTPNTTVIILNDKMSDKHLSDADKALLDHGDSVSLLTDGVHGSSVRVVAYPKTEHKALLKNGKPITNSPLNLTLTARTAVIKQFPEKDRESIRAKKANALKLTFTGTRAYPCPRVDWETTHKSIEPLVMEHVKHCLNLNKNTSVYISKLLTPDPSYPGEFSVPNHTREKLKLQTFCLKVLSDSPYEPSATEDTTIRDLVLGEQQLLAIPTEAAALNRYTVAANNYKIAMLSLRDMLNHTYLRTIHEVSDSKAKDGIKERHQEFLTAQEAAGPPPVGTPLPLFTAKDIIAYIEGECITDSAKRILSCEKALRELIRRTDSKPLFWLEQFTQPILALVRAQGTDLTPDQVKEWKKHFSSQISMEERQQMDVHQKQFLITTGPGAVGNPSTALMNKIARYLSGEFDLVVMKKLLTLMNNVFKGFIPDDTTMTYVRKHAKDLEWDYPPDVRSLRTHPREGSQGRERPRKDNKPASSNDVKRQRNRTSKSGDLKNKNRNSHRERPVVPQRDQCRRRECKARGNHVHHTHDNCRFKDPKPTKDRSSGRGRGGNDRSPNKGKGKGKSKGKGLDRDNRQFVNLGRAKQKSNQPSLKEDASNKEPCFLCKKPGCTDHKCYSCGGNHRKSDCPKAQEVKDRLKNSTYFTSMMSTVFTPDEHSCVNRIINAYGTPVCEYCLVEHDALTDCSSHDLDVVSPYRRVKNKLRNNPDIMDTVQQAHYFEEYHHSHDKEDRYSNITTLNETSIMDDEGQDSTHSEDPEENFFSQTQEYDFFQPSSKEKATDGNKRSWDEQNSSSFDWEDEQYQNKRHQTESDQSPHNSEDDEDDHNGPSSPYVERYNEYDSQESDQDY